MKIRELLRSGKVTLSCEVFPPKESTQLAQVQAAVERIAGLRPSFMSVTYGAGGGTSAHTVEIARHAQAQGVTALAHLTCVSATREQVAQALTRLEAAGIDNVLALRGDLPAGGRGEGDYRHASDLIADIRGRGVFCIGAACYPEGHPESRTKQEDLDMLRRKVDSGVDFLTTQMFFDNNILYHYLYRVAQVGIRVPVVAGIMPVTNAKQIKRICELSGTALPPRFAAIVDRFMDNPKAMRQAGIAYATEQIIDLIANGVEAVHLYTMNNPAVAAKIFANLSEIWSPLP